MLRTFFNSFIILLLMSTSLQAQSEENPVGIAVRHISSNFDLPDNNFSGLDDFDSGLEFEYFHYLNKTFDFSIPVRISGARIPNTNNNSIKQRGIMAADFMINLNIYKGKIFRPRLFAGFGAMLVDSKDVKMDVPIGVGLNFYLGDNISLATNFAYQANNENLFDHFKVGIGLHLALESAKDPEPVIKDMDGDGIIDAEDLCPTEAGVIALNGCPDKDGDGIADASDKCPDTAGISKFEGCPDTDEDGLQDSEDKCPEQAGPADNEGCPVTDRDGDGVEDAKDDCPDVMGTVANNGCPEKSLFITAKDKITNEVLPKTEIAILDSNGQVVKTGTTNSLGIAEFTDIAPGDYSINGKLYNIDLEKGELKASDFNASEAIQKTIYYNDPNFIVQGKVFFCNSPKALSGVKLNLKNRADNFMKSSVSDATGAYIFHLSSRATYELYATKENFLSQVVNVDTKDYDRSKSVFVRLEVCADEVKCGEAIRLDNILYDSGQSFIREDAKPDLNKVVQFMKDNPDAKIELSSHTDSKGGASSNLALSNRRARTAADYIIARGIAASRVIGKGFGETRLLNRCADGVNCSASEHQINRRTEFKVICP